MQTRRAWTRAGRLAAVAAGALGLVAVGPVTAAQSQGMRLPGYVCQAVVADSFGGAVGHDCRAFNGAPNAGPVERPFLVESPRSLAVRCEFGFAEIPYEVHGRLCQPVR